MTQGSNGEGEQAWGPQDHLGGSSHTSPGAGDGLGPADPCTITTGKARWTDTQAYRGFCLSPCWGRIQDEWWADKRVSELCWVRKMFPWPNFFPIKKYSLSYAWHIALCKIIFRSHFPLDSPKAGGQISILSPLRRWGNWLTVTCWNETNRSWTWDLTIEG